MNLPRSSALTPLRALIGSGPKDRRADPHVGRPGPDGNLDVMTHAKAQLKETRWPAMRISKAQHFLKIGARAPSGSDVAGGTVISPFTLRDECLSMEWFRTRAEAAILIESWRQHYNAVRPHLSLNYLTPNEFKTKIRAIPIMNHGEALLT